jgi:hypothetical protein
MGIQKYIEFVCVCVRACMYISDWIWVGDWGLSSLLSHEYGSLFCWEYNSRDLRVAVHLVVSYVPET